MIEFVINYLNDKDFKIIEIKFKLIKTKLFLIY